MDTDKTCTTGRQAEGGAMSEARKVALLIETSNRDGRIFPAPSDQGRSHRDTQSSDTEDTEQNTLSARCALRLDSMPSVSELAT